MLGGTLRKIVIVAYMIIVKGLIRCIIVGIIIQVLPGVNVVANTKETPTTAQNRPTSPPVSTPVKNIQSVRPAHQSRLKCNGFITV